MKSTKSPLAESDESGVDEKEDLNTSTNPELNLEEVPESTTLKHAISSPHGVSAELPVSENGVRT